MAGSDNRPKSKSKTGAEATGKSLSDFHGEQRLLEFMKRTQEANQDPSNHVGHPCVPPK